EGRRLGRMIEAFMIRRNPDASRGATASGPVPQPGVTPRAGRPWLIPLLLVLATVAALVPVCGHDFILDWDDGGTVAHNPLLNPPRWYSLKAWWVRPQIGLYIPVTYTVWGA